VVGPLWILGQTIPPTLLARADGVGGVGSNSEEDEMAESVYKVVELIGTSPESWEKAARVAVETAAEALRDLRIAEVVEQDLQVEEGKVIAYRVKVKLSLKYERNGND
jgi:flavin-binding protein dodecin